MRTPGTSFKTLILTDDSRLADDGHKTGMWSDLQAFANLPSVNGTIVDVGSVSPQVSDLQAQADLSTNVGCPYAETLVASSIRQIVKQVRAKDPQLKYIVIVGNDHVIPFFRYSDTAPAESTESGFNPPVRPDSTSFASLQSNDFLSQDAYGSSRVLDVNGQQLPVPDLPVGRLVNTPGEIDGLLQAYMGLNGGVVKTPSSSLVTGYDFMSKAAYAVEDDLSAGIGHGTGTKNDTLIQPDGDPPSASWTADQLNAALTGSRHDLIFLAGHFNASGALAADFSTAMSASQLTQSNVDLKNSIVFSPGCHSGYNVVPGDAVQGVTQTPDWVEAFAQKQATLIAGTGYQYGDTDFLAYSDQLYANFSHDLRLGSGPVAVGAALVQAKQDYLNGVSGSYPNQAGTGVNPSNPNIPSNAVDPSNLQGIDIKSLLESTLFGLPMTSVNLPSGRIPAPGSASIVASTTPAPDGPGKTLGLSWFDITRSPTLTTQTTQLNTATGGTLTATYLQGPSGNTTSPGAPALPLDTSNVTYDSEALRGVGFRGGTYIDTNGITPLTGAPATDLNGVHYTFGSSVFYPDPLAKINYLGGLAAGTNATQLVVTPAQYKSDAPGSPTNTQRAYSTVGLRLFYSGNTTTYGSNTPALTAPPAILRIDATVAGGAVTFQAHVVGDPQAGIQDVWVTYAGVHQPSGASGEWESIDLTQDDGDPTLWSGTLSGLTDAQIGSMDFMVQAVNGVGLVSLDDNQGRYFQPDQIPPALRTAQTTLTPSTLHINAPVPSSGGYGSTAAVSATLTGAGDAPVSGQEVLFTIGSSTVDASTNTSGIASAQIPLTNNPGSGYKLNASFGGSSTFAGSSAPATSFSIQKLPTTLAMGGNGSATVAFGGNSQIAATLASSGVGLASYPVAFVFAPSNQTSGSPVVQQATTGVGGVASLVIGTQLPPGTYVVQAYFGSPGPNLHDDPIFAPSATATTFALTVVAPAITSVNAATFTTGSSGSFTVKTNGFPIRAISNANFTGCAKSALPTGVTLAVKPDGTATLSGTPAAGTNAVYTLCLNASDGLGSSATQVFTLTVTTLLGSGTTACNGVYSGSGSQLTVAAGAVCAAPSREQGERKRASQSGREVERPRRDHQREPASLERGLDRDRWRRQHRWEPADPGNDGQPDREQ